MLVLMLGNHDPDEAVRHWAMIEHQELMAEQVQGKAMQEEEKAGQGRTDEEEAMSDRWYRREGGEAKRKAMTRMNMRERAREV